MRPGRQAGTRIAALLLFGLASSGAASCSRAPKPRLGPEGGFRNLLLVSFDTTRADHLGCYGSKSGATPVLDELARGGVLFETCITPAPITLAAHASLLTGLLPCQHGARNNGTHRLAPDVPTLAERLKPLGFATGAVVSAFVLDSRFGLERGFDQYDDDLSGGGLATAFAGETRAEDTLARAERWLGRRGQERWFLWVHFFDPHADYDAPEPYRSRFSSAPYDGEIAYADACLGTLRKHLAERGVLDQTLVVMASDHGEALGEHGEATHGIFVYDATSRVPLILSHPALRAGTRVPAVVGLSDVVPTVLELLGAPPASGLAGRSLAGVALGTQPELESLPAYTENELVRYDYGWAGLRALRDEHYRYVRAPRPELYDLRLDPGETHDRIAEEPEVAARYEKLLRQRIPVPEKNTRSSSTGEVEPEVKSKLAALGYTFSAAAADADALERPDPKDRIDGLRSQQTAEGFLHAGRLAEAETAYRALLGANPQAIAVRDALANVLMKRGALAEALEIQRGSLELPGVTATNFLIAAELENRLGLEGWRRTLELAKAFDPRASLPWVREGDLVHLPAHPDAALAAYRAALERDEHCAPAWVGIGRVEAQRRNLAGALEAAVHATECDPRLAEAWFLSGSMHAASGKREEALACFRRARELDPADVKTRLALTLLSAAAGDEAAALVELRAALERAPEEVRAAAAGNAQLQKLLERAR